MPLQTTPGFFRTQRSFEVIALHIHRLRAQFVPVDPKNWAHEEMQISKFRGDHEIVIVNPVVPIPAELQQPATQQIVK